MRHWCGDENPRIGTGGAQRGGRHVSLEGVRLHANNNKSRPKKSHALQNSQEKLTVQAQVVAEVLSPWARRLMEAPASRQEHEQQAPQL